MEVNQKRLMLTLGIGLFLIFGFFFITEAITKYTGFSVAPDDDNDFEICLEEQDITLYVNTADITTTLNKMEVIDYLDKIKIFNCERNNQACLEAGVVSPPTWIINNQIIPGEISLDDLAKYSECQVINKI